MGETSNMIKNGGIGMAEIWAGIVLEGRVTSEQAIYTFYYRFPSYADGLVETMNTIFLIEGRKELVKSYDQIQEIKKKADDARNRYYQAIGAKTAEPAKEA